MRIFFFASDVKAHSLDLESQEKYAEKSLRKLCDVGLRCGKSTCFLRSSDAKCPRFGLSLRFGLRCECPRCQIASDAGRAVRTTFAPQHHNFHSVVLSPGVAQKTLSFFFFCWLRFSQGSGKVFASQERVSGFPEKGLTSGEVRETSGEVRETSGEVWETSGEPLDCCKVPQ